MDYCINHTSERAVGLCGTCQRPACYRCSLTIDQVIYCSTACFNERPAKAKAAPTPAVALADEFSDVVAAIDARMSASERVAASEPSVVLSAHLADDHSGTTMLGMSPVPGTLDGGDGSTLLTAGTKRSLLSSSCFFHPDTSAIVLCAKCRNPICTLCAKEAPEGLLCSPSCGPPDLVGIRDRRNVTMINAALVAALVLVFSESAVLLWASRNADRTLAEARVAPAAAAVSTEPLSADPELRRVDALVKEATTLLRDAADGAELGRKPATDAASLTSWLVRTVGKLRQARDILTARGGESPDPDVKRRIESVTALLEALRAGNDPVLDAPRSPTAAPR